MTGDDDRSRRGDQPGELELADVPRFGALRGAARTIAPADERPLPPDLGELPATPAAARPLLDEPSPWLRRIVAIVVVAVAAYVGWRVYRRFTRPDVYAVSSPYRSSAGVTIALPPGGGWQTDRRARVTRTNGPSWLRADAIFRGGDLRSAAELVVLVRVHGPGAFARTIDREGLRATLENSVRQQANAFAATVRNLSCVDEDTWQSGIAEVCYGRLGFFGRDIGAAAYLWIVGDDDLIGIIYGTDGVSLDALEVMAKSAR